MAESRRGSLAPSRSTLVTILVLALLFVRATPAFAQEEAAQVPPLLAQMAVLVFLSLLPFLVMLLTSFTKIVIVLSLLRNALGVQQAPPNQVINGMAILLSVYVMAPTGMAIYHKSQTLIHQQLPTNVFSAGSADFIVNVIQEGADPLRQFLIKNTRAKHQRAFYRLANKFFPEDLRSSLKPQDFMVMIPAFITSQVEDAFQIGVLIYLPFFVIDLVTSNILLAMGMMMLSPMTIALPLKLLLLVMLDGWALLVQGLVLTFRP